MCIRDRHYAFLVMDSKILANDIFIPFEYLGEGKDGDKVVVEIVEWPERANNPIGKVIDVLGKPGENTAEMHAILAQYHLPYKYPREVEMYAESLSDKIPEEEYAKREDFRDVPTITIDPADAKDFDDALSLRKLSNNRWEVAVSYTHLDVYKRQVWGRFNLLGQ